jgi:hypothetical protein
VRLQGRRTVAAPTGDPALFMLSELPSFREGPFSAIE